PTTRFATRTPCGPDGGGNAVAWVIALRTVAIGGLGPGPRPAVRRGAQPAGTSLNDRCAFDAPGLALFVQGASGARPFSRPIRRSDRCTGSTPPQRRGPARSSSEGPVSLRRDTRGEVEKALAWE